MAGISGNFKIVVTRINHGLDVTTHGNLQDLIEWTLDRIVCEHSIEDSERLAYVGEAENICLNALDSLRKSLSQPDYPPEDEDDEA